MPNMWRNTERIFHQVKHNILAVVFYNIMASGTNLLIDKLYNMKSEENAWLLISFDKRIRDNKQSAI